MDQTKLDSFWKENSEVIKEFLDQTNSYKQLCDEISYILKKKIVSKKIEISSISTRCKTLKSFLEKIGRKKYKNPFSEITDFAGVRIVHLYESDYAKIEEIIVEEFQVIEKVDKLNDKGIDKFGYGAVHFIVKIGEKSTGVRYDDLKNLPCEIQVRTVLQDAWAIIDHHLVYKRESEIPTSLQRKLNGLAGLFATADNQFENLRRERDTYLNNLKQTFESPEFLGNELNLDTFMSYLSFKFPEKKAYNHNSQVSLIVKDLQNCGLSTLADIDKIVNKNLKFIKPYEEGFFNDTKKHLSSALTVDICVVLEIKKYYQKGEYTPSLQKLIEAHWNLK